ncbi:unnamed protein product [Leptosia nina]|uniref:Uncharacterized protein n=1 Tax=Leptosia nina TaxID=320188 RepID=A0AAV1JLB7_9NEOP
MVSIDKSLNLNEERKHAWRSFGLIVLLISIEEIWEVIALNHIFGPNFDISTCMSWLQHVNQVLSHTPTSIIYELSYLSMKCLRTYLNMHLKSDIAVNVKSCHLKKFIQAYKNLLDATNDANKVIKIKLFFDLVFVFGSVVTDINLVFAGINLNDLYLTFLPLVTALTTILLTLVGVIFLDLSRTEYEKIKTALAMELIKCEDADYHKEIMATVDFLEIRPPCYTLWRIFPLNINLIFGFVNCAIVYAIIILSFL